MPEITAIRQDRTFVDRHGVTIHYYVWTPPRPHAVVQLVHGLGEYANRYSHLIQHLVDAGYVVYADDHRGHGQTGLEQWGGDATKLGRLGPGGVRATVDDVYEVTRLARADHPELPLVLLGHSLGSLFAQMILARHADDYAAAVLTGTAYRTPFAMNSGNLNARHAKLGTTGHEWLSRDVAVHEAFVADPLTFKAQAAKLFGVVDGARLLGTPKKLARDLPLYIAIGSDDSLGGPKSVERLARAYREKGGLSDVSVVVYPDARHEIFHELNKDEVVADLLAWLGTRLPS